MESKSDWKETDPTTCPICKEAGHPLPHCGHVTYGTARFHLEDGFYSVEELQSLLDELREVRRLQDAALNRTMEQPAQPYKGMADHFYQATDGRMRIDPVTGDVGVGTPSEQPAQDKPVAYIRKDQLQKAAQSPMLCEVTPEPRQDRIGIYTRPARAPLTDEQIDHAAGLRGSYSASLGEWSFSPHELIEFARAIEAAHGIGEKK